MLLNLFVILYIYIVLYFFIQKIDYRYLQVRTHTCVCVCFWLKCVYIYVGVEDAKDMATLEANNVIWEKFGNLKLGIPITFSYNIYSCISLNTNEYYK